MKLTATAPRAPISIAASPVSRLTGGTVGPCPTGFLRNSFMGCRIGDQRESHLLRAPAEVVEHPLAVALFIVRGAGIRVGEAESERIVEENGELPSRSGDRLGLTDSGGEAPIEGAERRVGSADVHRGDSQQSGGAIGGATGLRAEQ